MAREPAGFDQLSKAEKIRYLQQLWDRIAEGPGEIPVPPSHIELAERRLAEHRRGRTRTRPALDIIRRLTKKKR